MWEALGPRRERINDNQENFAPLELNVDAGDGDALLRGDDDGDGDNRDRDAINTVV